MDRKAIKEEAKKMIPGNKWNVWKPLLLMMLIIFAVSFVAGIFGGIIAVGAKNGDLPSIIGGIVGGVLGIVLMPMEVGIFAYYLDIVRGKKPEFKGYLTKYYNQFGKIFVASLIVEILVTLASFLFVIPGIILALAYNFYLFVLIDNPDLGWKEILTKSREMMKGHKGELFVFYLSFIGWLILSGLTMHILMIWLLPYMTLAEVLWYDKLSKLK